MTASTLAATTATDYSHFEGLSPEIASAMRIVGLLVFTMWVLYALYKFVSPLSRRSGLSMSERVGGAGPFMSALLLMGFTVDVNVLLKMGYRTYSLIASGLTGGTNTSPAPTPAPVPTPTFAPAPDTSPQGSVFDPTILLWVGGGILGVFVLIILGAGVYSYTSARRDAAKIRAAERADALEAWTEAETIRARVEQNYTEVICDPMTVLSCPEIDNTSNPAVATFYNAWDTLSDAKCSSGSSLDRSKAYLKAASEFERTWTNALSDAKKIGVSNMSAESRSEIRRAQHLLSVAMDDGASAPERQLSLERARVILDGLNLCAGPQRGAAKEILSPLTLQIETVTRAALEAAPTA